MKTSLLILSIFLLHSLTGFSQTRLRKLPITINHPAINVSAPYTSFDGNTLVYISDNSDENQLTMFYTTKRDAVNWKEPIMLPKTVNNRLNFLNGFALSPDGRRIYLSSLKSGGLGGFDIVTSDLRGAIWSEPVNLGLPINSLSHEACPSVSIDESTLYFMRCEKMDQKSAAGCKILVSKKNRLGRWEEPTELPAYINTGNSQAPRILGDSETLIFSSDQLPQNKGGMDLYITRLESGQWSKPIPLDFANTANNDQFVSASSLGRYLLMSQPGARTSEIVEVLFPAEVKPKATVKIDGKISGLENPSSPYIAVFDQKDQSRVFSGRPEKDGSFTFYLKEGTRYDLSIEPEKDNYTFFSKIYDLTGDQIPMADRIDVEIKPLTVGTEMSLGLTFKPRAAEVASSGVQDIRRLVRLVKGNPNRKFLIDVKLAGYLSDSIKSDPDLTELRLDTVHYQVEKQVPDTVRLDSILMVLNRRDSLTRSSADSTLIATRDFFKAQMDSLSSKAFKTVMVDSIAIRKTYHNDRTLKQAQHVVDYLINEGAIPANLSLSNRAVPEQDPARRNTTVTIKVIQ